MMGIERVLLEKFSGAASGRSYRSTTFDDPRREDEAAGKGRRGAHSRDDPGRGEQDVERDGCQGIL